MHIKNVKDIEEEEEQARYMRDALQYFKGRVTRLFWYSLKDDPGEEKHTGLIGGDEKPRLAYYELQRALEEEIPFWMQWWFWIIIAVVIVALAGVVYFLKKRKPPTPTAPTLPSEGTP